MSNSVRPHRRQPTRLPRPWDSPSKNTGVGCHFLLQCMKVKSESEVTQLSPTLRDCMDCHLPGSSVHGIFQARVPEWGAIVFSAPYCLSKSKSKCFWTWIIAFGMFFFQMMKEKVKQFLYLSLSNTFPGSLVGKESACSAGHPGSIPGLG